MGLLKSGMSWLADTLKTEGVSATYRRASASASISVVMDEPQQSGLDAAGNVTTFGERDFCVEQSELGALWPPLRGDVIDVVFGSTNHRWNVTAASNGRTSDDLDTQLLRVAIHTVYKGTV